MSTRLNSAFIECIKCNRIITLWPKEVNKNLKVALVGECSVDKSDHTLCGKLSTVFRINKRNITIFTAKKKFTVEDGKDYDILLGCRPCKAEALLFESATKYNKRFAILPCACNNLKMKAIELIKKYPVINRIDSCVEAGTNVSWLVLYNTKYA